MAFVYIAPSIKLSALGCRVWVHAGLLDLLPMLDAADRWQHAKRDGMYMPCRIVCHDLDCSDSLRILVAFIRGFTGGDIGSLGDLDHCPAAVAKAIYAAMYLGADHEAANRWVTRLIDDVSMVSTPGSPGFDALRLEILGRRGRANRVLLELCRRVLENAGWDCLVNEVTAQSRLAGALGEVRSMDPDEIDRVRGRVVAAGRVALPPGG